MFDFRCNRKAFLDNFRRMIVDMFSNVQNYLAVTAGNSTTTHCLKDLLHSARYDERGNSEEDLIPPISDKWNCRSGPSLW